LAGGPTPSAQGGGHAVMMRTGAEPLAPFPTPVLIGMTLVLVLLSCTAGRYSPGSSVDGHATQGMSVPDVVGLSTTHAVAVVEGAGFRFRIIPVGGTTPTMVGQDPAAGSLAARGITVTLRASCLPAPCPFPGEGKTIYDPCTCAAR
jgi:hypothetical protein